MARPSRLDEPDYSRFAWARYWRLMRWMCVVAAISVAAALGALYLANGDGLSIHMIIATAGGVAVSVLLASALMGLVFLSSGSGHDDAIEDPLEEQFPTHE